MMRIGLLLSAGLLASAAHAATFNQFVPTESRLTFDYQQMGVNLDGKFNRFQAQLNFDPARLAVSQARIDVELASIDTGSEEGNDAVVGKPWFNVKDFPSASFVSTGVKPLGNGRYEVSGKLSIKGHSVPVIAPATFQSTGNRGVFDGSFAIKRLDYAIGEGEWADLGTVANGIQVHFHFVVTAAPSRK